MLDFVLQLCEGCRSSKRFPDRSERDADFPPILDLDTSSIVSPSTGVSEQHTSHLVEIGTDFLARETTESGVPLLSDTFVTSTSGQSDMHSTPFTDAPLPEESLLQTRLGENGTDGSLDTQTSICVSPEQKTSVTLDETALLPISPPPGECTEKERPQKAAMKKSAPKSASKRKPKAVTKKSSAGGGDSLEGERKLDKTEAETGAPASLELEPQDELNWLTLSEGFASSPVIGLTDSPEVGEDKGARRQIQILLASGWCDVPQTESDLIFSNLAAGQAKFAIRARGTMYAIDFSSMNAGVQTNMSTDKKRRLRILNDEAIDSEDFEPQKSGQNQNQEGAASTGIDKDQQLRYGPQSKRGNAQQYQLSVLDMHPHAKQCFETLARNEEKLCGEWAAFYHSYSYSALIYEVHAAIGAVLFRFRSQYAPLPRLIMREFASTPDAASLMQRFEEKYAASEKDHHPEYRALAISAMCSLVALGPEASPPVVFVAGYSQADLSFRSVLEHLLASCFVPKGKIKKVASEILDLSERSGLDVSQFGGKKCASGKAGHLLQIFIKRALLDRLVYAAQPWGAVDCERQPISRWLNGDSNTNWGQARVLAHPEIFMQANSVRMHVVSADPTFHSNRVKFQEELTQLLGVVLADPDLRTRAATALYGGKLPRWWTSEDQRMVSASSK